MDCQDSPRPSKRCRTQASQKRRADANSSDNRRTGNACRRCKNCVFDVAADGIPRGAAYIADLEAQVHFLRAELRAANLRLQPLGDGSPENPGTLETLGIEHRCSGEDEMTLVEILRGSNATQSGSDPYESGSLKSTRLNEGQSTASPPEKLQQPLERPLHIRQKAFEAILDSKSDITIFNFLQSGPSTARVDAGNALPELPSGQVADHLVEMAYLYTQARYCIVDWVRLHQWHQQREAICSASAEDDVESQIGAYFIWIIYAIGAQLVPNSEHLSTGYYAHALNYLPLVLAQQNMVALQGILTLAQYHFRAPGGPSLWHLVGVAVRLCIELRYHRKVQKSIMSQDLDPYTIELQKRFFWCVYCFDRMLAMILKRPFGIQDFDIDVELPIDVDVTCVDQEKLRDLQTGQAAGEIFFEEGTAKTMTAALHHLQIYRLRSSIITRFTGPRALPPSYDVMELFSDLAEWRQRAPRRHSASTLLPQPSDTQIEATYFDATLLLVRIILAQLSVDPALLLKCAELSADACKNTRTLSLSPQTHSSPIIVYNCFRCGITLLQCLTVQPTILSLRDIHKALSSCSSALTIYTQKVTIATPFLQLFEKLSDRFLRDSEAPEGPHSDMNTLRSILQTIASSGPSETLELFHTLLDEPNQQDPQTSLSMAETLTAGDVMHPDFLWGMDSMSTLGMDLLMPYEMVSDIPLKILPFRAWPISGLQATITSHERVGTMGLKRILDQSALFTYARAIKAAPREVIFNRTLLLTSLLYALSALPLTWDQGSAAVLGSLPSFQNHFGISSGTDPKAIRNFVSLVGVGDFIGAGLSFFVNDRIGRLWSYRLYVTIWIVGQIIAIFANNLATLYAARIICGLGIGALLVTGPISIVEIAPPEIRGLLTSWFTVVMGLAHGVSTFCVYGVYNNPSLQGIRLQYQVVWFAPCIFMGFCIVASFFLCESPRWLFLVNREEEATKILVKIRGLPLDDPRVQSELKDIRDSVRNEADVHGDVNRAPGVFAVIKETFTVPSNLRRVQQVLILYSLPQLSGANSISSYFVPILKIIGSAGDTSRNLFLSGMYTMSKFFFALIASFFFVDALGRRKSLFVGITCQMLSDLYMGLYVRAQQKGHVPDAASQTALAAVFIQAFGYSIGLLTLPYVFAGELWPTRIRSFGAAMSQCFHRLFIYAMSFGLPSLLESTDNWGAFLFFSGWCFLSLLYVFLVIPEVAGLSVEELDRLFTGPWFNAYKRRKQVPPGPTDSENGNNLTHRQSKVSVEERD
ncbi:Quinate permease-like protein [Cladobotryum mycophilum]|uniref:Quinate permease-like protein n=1 Tax=Cladobotryum mycophilum TaxID=491253 RepID=A0ABR0SR31_9HYPO